MERGSSLRPTQRPLAASPPSRSPRPPLSPPSPFWPNPPPQGMEEVSGNEDAEELTSLSSPSCHRGSPTLSPRHATTGS